MKLERLNLELEVGHGNNRYFCMGRLDFRFWTVPPTGHMLLELKEHLTIMSFGSRVVSESDSNPFTQVPYFSHLAIQESRGPTRSQASGPGVEDIPGSISLRMAQIYSVVAIT